MSIKQDIWLMQRLSEPTGYVNPFGDVNHEIKDKSITDIIEPDYMGAAEYEFGTYRNCIDVMLKHGTKSSIIALYPDKRMNASIPIHIVSSKGCEDTEVVEQIRHLYFGPSLTLHETGMLPEISKNDRSSFYRECRHLALCNFKEIKTHGWLNVKKFYAFFIERELAESFNNYCNQAKEVAA